MLSGDYRRSHLGSPPSQMFHRPSMGVGAHPADQQTGGTNGSAADLPDTPNPNETQNKVITLPQAIFHDQIGMWTSPSKVRYSDATWLVPAWRTHRRVLRDR